MRSWQTWTAWWTGDAMGVLLVMASIILTERSYPNAQHQGGFYVMCSATYAFYLAIAARAARSWRA